MLLPIARDQAEIRRHAWISYTIIALNILVFVVVGVAEREAEKTLDERWRTAIDYHIAHPYLKTPPAMQRLIGEEGAAHFERLRRQYGPVPFSRVAEEQRQLDDHAAAAEQSRRERPKYRLGYVPAEGRFFTIVTSMFLHAGLLHLAGNLLYLFFSGPFVEDVFGRALFALLYVAGGVVATLTHASRHSDSVIPLIGASGAIAAVMGAYLVRFARTKIELLFIPVLLRPDWNYRFWMPAFVVLPVWFVHQLWGMRFEEQSGIGFSAHVGGFAFGVLFAMVVKLTKVEEKYVDPVVVRQTSWTLDDRLVRAMASRHRGDDEQARRDLGALLRDGNASLEALQLAVDLARGGDPAIHDAAAARLLARYIDTARNDAAIDLIRETTSDRGAPLRKFLARAAPFVERTGDREWALTLYERLYAADRTSTSAVSSLVKISALRRWRGDFGGARHALEQARQHPACNAEWARAIASKLAQLG